MIITTDTTEIVVVTEESPASIIEVVTSGPQGPSWPSEGVKAASEAAQQAAEAAKVLAQAAAVTATTQADISTVRATAASTSAVRASEAALAAAQDQATSHANMVQTTADRNQTGLDVIAASQAQGYALNAAASADIAVSNAGSAQTSATQAAASLALADTKAGEAANSAESAYYSNIDAAQYSGQAFSYRNTASTHAASALSYKNTAVTASDTATAKAAIATAQAVIATDKSTLTAADRVQTGLDAASAASSVATAQTLYADFTAVNAAAATATTKASEASDSAVSAGLSKDSSLASKNSAEASAITTSAQAAIATGAATSAQAWAITPVDTLVSDVDYSALHWAAKSAESQGIAGSFATSANDAKVAAQAAVVAAGNASRLTFGTVAVGAAAVTITGDPGAQVLNLVIPPGATGATGATGPAGPTDYTLLTNAPTLGTSAALDVPATGNAGSTQVVKGSDTRLSDDRSPTAHSHTATATAFSPAGGIAATNVQAAIVELDAEKLPLTGGKLTGALNFSPGAGQYSYNLSTDVSNYERYTIRWSGNVLLLNTEKAGVGAQRNIGLQTAGGNVGIGTATPTKKLQVEGDVGFNTSSSGGLTYDAALNKLTLQQKIGQTANLLEVRDSDGSLTLSINPDGNHLAPTFIDPVGSLRAGGYIECGGYHIESALAPSTGGEGDVLLASTSASRATKKAITSFRSSPVVGVGGWVNAPGWFHSRGRAPVNADTGAVAIGDRLVISPSLDGAVCSDATGDLSLSTVGYALSSKAAGSAGKVEVWVDPIAGISAFSYMGGNAGFGTVTPDEKLHVVGNIKSTGAVLTGYTTVSGLPSAAALGAGARHFVTDATATTFLSIVAGGGTNKVPVVSDGANWLIG